MQKIYQFGSSNIAVRSKLLAISRFELAPDTTPEEVQAYADLVKDATDIPVALSAIKVGVNYAVTRQVFQNSCQANTAHVLRFREQK